jgi:site-specific recombinase XerD
MTTAVKVVKYDWDNLKQRVKGNSDLAKQYNALLHTLKSKAFSAYEMLCRKDTPFTTRDIVDTINGKHQKVIGILQAFDHFIQAMLHNVGTDYAMPTVIKYKATRSILCKFITSTGRKDISLNDVDRKCIADFDQYQRGELKRQNNSVNKTHQQVKKVLRQARINGWMVNDPYDFYKAKATPTSKPFLTFHELEPLINFQSDNNRLMKTRDVFLFCCFTGLAHSDVKRLSTSHLKIGVDGKRWIELARQKTGVLTMVPLLPIADSILQKYAEQKAFSDDSKLLPVPCSQVFNRGIRNLLQTVGINKKCTSHSCRYTFASTVLMGTGIPLEIAGKLLGHNSIRSTQHYSKLSEKRIADATENLGDWIESKLRHSLGK